MPSCIMCHDYGVGLWAGCFRLQLPCHYHHDKLKAKRRFHWLWAYGAATIYQARQSVCTCFASYVHIDFAAGNPLSRWSWFGFLIWLVSWSGSDIFHRIHTLITCCQLVFCRLVIVVTSTWLYVILGLFTDWYDILIQCHFMMSLWQQCVVAS